MLSAVAGVGSVMRPQRIGNLWADTTKSGLWILFTGDAVALSGLACCLGKYYSEPSWTLLRQLFAFEWSSQAQILEFLIFLYFCLTYWFENVHRGFTAGDIIVVVVSLNCPARQIYEWMLLYFQGLKEHYCHTSKPLHMRYFHSVISERRINSFSQNCLLKNVAFLLMAFLKTKMITEMSKGCQRMLFTEGNQLTLAQWRYCV